MNRKLNKLVEKLFYVLIAIVTIQSCTLKNQPTLNYDEGWKIIGPGGGGATFIPTFSYHNPDHFLVRCDMTGAYLTRDGGVSYKMINNPNGSHCFAYDPNDPETIYIGGTILNQSTDGGQTWKRIFPKKEEIVSENWHGDHGGYSLAVTEKSMYPGRGGMRNLIVDPNSSESLYMSMGAYFLYSTNKGSTWNREEMEYPVEYLYTNASGLKSEVYIFTAQAIYIFNKASKEIRKRELPKNLNPASFFTAGTLKDSDKTVFYAIHFTKPKENVYATTTSEVWLSYDNGVNWSRVEDPVVTNVKTGVKPSYIKIVCSERDAANAYLVANIYEDVVDGKKIYWYGALKTSDAGKTWNWVYQGGGGSGQYGVEDAMDAENLRDAWVHEAFGSELVQLMDVGVSPMEIGRAHV